MNITCPNCGFGRTVNEKSLTPKAAWATCPKCQHRFKFRDLNISPEPHQDVVSPHPAEAEPSMAPGPHASPEPAHESKPAQTEASPLPEPPKPADPPRDEDLWSELEALDPENADREGKTQAQTVLPAWERATGGYPQAFAQTFVDVLLNPKGFFSAMPVGHGLLKPLFFFLVIIQAVALSQAVWQLLGIIEPGALTENLGAPLQAALILFLYPLEVGALLFLDTAINHFFLRLFKADTKGFEGTFRAEAYSAAPMLLMVIPYIGLPLAMIGTTVYKFLGLRHVHGASNKQVLAALILPMLLVLTVAVVLTVISGWI